MKYGLIILLALLIVGSCTSEKSTIAPETCNPVFHADSLTVEVNHIFLVLIGTWVWEVSATYNYELEECSGKIHTHEFTFVEPGEIFTIQDNTVTNCGEPTDVELEKSVSFLTPDDIFAGLDSVTVYFTLSGLFQQCDCCSVDSIAPISWSDTVRAEVID